MERLKYSWVDVQSVSFQSNDQHFATQHSTEVGRRKMECPRGRVLRKQRGVMGVGLCVGGSEGLIALVIGIHLKSSITNEYKNQSQTTLPRKVVMLELCIVEDEPSAGK